MRAGDFMEQVAVDVDEIGAVIIVGHYVTIPHFFKESLSGHCRALVSKPVLSA